MPSASLLKASPSLLAALLFLGVFSLAHTGAMQQKCEYTGHSAPEEVKKDVGSKAGDKYFFTTYSDIEDIKGSSHHRYIRSVYNRGPSYLLPFEWPTAGLSYKELGTDSCT